MGFFEGGIFMGNPAYAEDYDVEIINGREVMMSPRPAISHIRVANNINNIFYNFLKEMRGISRWNGTSPGRGKCLYPRCHDRL